MPHASQDLLNTEETLKNVIQILVDGQDGFQNIGKHLDDVSLREYFLAESLKRAQFRGDLETILHQEGVHEIKETGTAAGTVHAAWADLKAKLGGGDHTLLATAERGEDEALKTYEKAITSSLPMPVKQLLVEQARHIRHSHDHVRAARDLRRD
jgi:uncharacterized protein (TIGR02284 family)